MHKSIFSIPLLAVAVTATPALASDKSTDPVSGFNLADVPGSEVVLPTNTKAELPSPIFGMATEEVSSPVSFGGTVVSKYIFSDLYVQTDSPTAQVWASVDTNIIGIKGCSVDLFASHGFTTTVGREFDVGASCRFDLAKDVNVELSASRYILGGASDITTLVAKVSHGPVAASVTQYIVDGSEPDATKVELGLTVEPAKRLSLRGVFTYEHGFGLPDIYVGGVEANYAVTDHWALTFSGYAPLHLAAGDPRSSEVAVGVQFNF